MNQHFPSQLELYMQRLMEAEVAWHPFVWAS